MRELSLFTGAGGGILGTHLLGWTPIGYVEFNDYCQRVLAQRITDGHIPEAPIFGDIRAFIGEGYAERYRNMVEVITAGFPCQPFSSAARGRNRPGADMWPAALVAISIIRPPLVWLENVSRVAIGRAAADLRAIGYSCRTATASSASVGAPVLRRREWLLGRADSQGEPVQPINDEVARLQVPAGVDWWAEDPAPSFRVPDGVASRMDRLKAIGNGQVPAVVRLAWEALRG